MNADHLSLTSLTFRHSEPSHMDAT